MGNVGRLQADSSVGCARRDADYGHADESGPGGRVSTVSSAWSIVRHMPAQTSEPDSGL
jgi:hypothetical protein